MLVITLVSIFGGVCAQQRAFAQAASQNRGGALESEQQYLAALRDADQDAFKADFEAEFLLLLEQDARAGYDSLSSLDARKAFVEQYWRASNPNPLMPENDWLLDFLRRRSYARKNFPAREPPFVDDRGKYYLKYGKPQVRYEDFGSLQVLPNETWSYENVARNFIVHFRREGTAYREIENLVMILAGKKIYDPYTEAQVLVAVARQRAAVSPVFGRVYARWLDLTQAPLRAQSFPSSREPLVIDWQQLPVVLYSAAQHAKAEVAYALQVAPVAVYDELAARNKIKFREEIAQFREPHGGTRIEIAMLAPLKKNLVKNPEREANDFLHLEYRGLLNDETFHPLREDRLRFDLPIGLATTRAFPNALGRLVLNAAPQKGDLTLQIRNASKDELGFVRKDITLRDFTGSALMLSDLQLLFEVTNEDQAQILPATRKQERMVAPYPFDKIRKSLPLLCYFEVYHLQTRECELTYTITAAKECADFTDQEPTSKPDKNAAAISVTMTRSTTDESLSELLALDLSELKKGEYCLEIAATDAQSSSVSARAQRHFVLED